MNAQSVSYWSAYVSVRAEAAAGRQRQPSRPSDKKTWSNVNSVQWLVTGCCRPIHITRDNQTVVLCRLYNSLIWLCRWLFITSSDRDRHAVASTSFFYGFSILFLCVQRAKERLPVVHASHHWPIVLSLLRYLLSFAPSCGVAQLCSVVFSDISPLTRPQRIAKTHVVQ